MEDKIRKGKDVFIAPGSHIIGDVQLGNTTSVWYGAVIRADSDSISIGEASNVQDNAVIHVDPGFPVIIGNSCSIGHGAIVHGAVLSDHVLVGINAVVLNGARIGSYSIIGANALVTAGSDIPERSMVLGSPAKVVRMLTEEERRVIEKNARAYVEKAKDYLDAIE